MSSISNITNNYENISKFAKYGKVEDSKIDNYILRKQINYSISNSFIPKDIQTPYFVSTLKQNPKSQFEEFQKLQSEIDYVEEKIRELEMSKKMKLVKVRIYLI
jgi:hypothetical protein